MKLLPEKRRRVRHSDLSLDQSGEQFDTFGIGKGNSGKVQNQGAPVLQVRSTGRSKFLHPWPNDSPFQDQYDVFGVTLFSYRNSQHSVQSLPVFSVKAPEVPKSTQSAGFIKWLRLRVFVRGQNPDVSPSPTTRGK